MSEEKCFKESEWVDVKKRIGRLEEQGREDFGIIKSMTTNIEIIAKSIDKQGDTIVEIGNTMISMKDNLDLLNKENKEIKADISDLKGKVNSKIVEDIKKTSWDFIDFIKNKLVPALIGAGAIYLILQVIAK